MILNIVFISIIIMLFKSINFKIINLNNYNNKNQSLCIKGFLALFILFHHILFQINNLNLFYEPFKYIAFPLVSLFLFYSGYGLMNNLKNQKNYLDNFFKKRCSKLILPYLLIILLYLVYEVVLLDNKSLFECIYSVIFATEIGPLWYMTTIFIVYILFFIIFRFFNKKKGINIFLILTILYILISSLTNEASQWYSSIIGFWFGLYFNYNEKRFVKILEQKFSKSLIFIICFGGLYILRLIISQYLTDIELIHGIYRNILSIMFILCVLIICNKIELKSKLLSFFGKISYEIYLIHPFVIYMFGKMSTNSFVIIYIFLITIFAAYFINNINNKIIYRLNFFDNNTIKMK